MELDIKAQIETVDVKTKLDADIKIKISKIDIFANALNENSEKHYCIICRKQNFLTLKILIEHMQNDHQKNIKKKKKCIICETSFHTKSISEKVLHMIECYQKKKKFSCAFCPELNFSTHPTLFKHTKFAHKDHKLGKGCVCVHCMKKFSEKSLGNVCKSRTTTMIHAGYYKSKKMMLKWKNI